MTTAKITSKGQITVPKNVRDMLGLAPGDELDFVEEDGEFRIRRHLRGSVFKRFRGYLGHLKGQDPDDIVEQLRGHE